MRILVTGASGYIGSRLVPLLLRRGVDVRCLTRNPANLSSAPWLDDVEIAVGDVADPDATSRALTGTDRAYYLVHSLDDPRAFAARERDGAAAFGRAAAEHGLDRIVYLGGLGDGGEASTARHLSAHLASRAEVGTILAGTGVPVTVLRAAMIVGAGSTSFELMRYLTERAPIVLGPRRLGAVVQPVAVGDVLHYLLVAGLRPEPAAGCFDVGGPDRLTYATLLRRYAALAGLPTRRVIPLPVPGEAARHLFGWAASQLTPMPRPLVQHLVESLSHDAACTDHDAAASTFGGPADGPTLLDDALDLALGADTGPASPAADTDTPWGVQPTDPAWAGGPSRSVTHSTRLHRPYSTTLMRLAELASDPAALSPAATGALGALAALFGAAPELPRSQRTDLVRRCAEQWQVESFRGRRLALGLVTPRGRVRLEFECVGDSSDTLVERLVYRPAGLGGELRWRIIAGGTAKPCEVLLRELDAGAVDPGRALAS